jgi:hypothetical protein
VCVIRKEMSHRGRRQLFFSGLGSVRELVGRKELVRSGSNPGGRVWGAHGCWRAALMRVG